MRSKTTDQTSRACLTIVIRCGYFGEAIRSAPANPDRVIYYQ